MTTSEQLEREAEATRIQIAATLDELRGRMTPGQIVDQFIDYVRDGSGGMFLENFRRQVVANPIPVTLVGAGLTWLGIASRRTDGGGGDLGAARTAGAARERAAEAGEGLRDAAWTAGDAASAAGDQAAAATERWTDSARQTGSEWAGQTRSAASRLGERANEAGARLQDTAGAAASALNETASAAYGAAAQGSRRSAELLGRTAGKMSDSMTASSHAITDFLKEQPLVVAGLGLALGALLGAALPGTETEDQLMGAASNAVKGETKGFAEHQLDKGKAVAQEAWNAASEELDQQSERGGAERARSAGAAFEGGHEAPLVPSNESGTAETASHGVHGEPEHNE